ncbi:unnamed protein product [Spirodela intermedia]|uniref:RING-type domain-containing protein n=1 Tax=Spirodela intermedia TaxID=51605 RepID=A0A7I8J3F0_SPIIN|nr:unnamed protein product [Spirodela intermedia]CAA6664570.1 unnamed protein product [Spirodela intermedia]
MVAAIIFFFVVVVMVIFLHVYAKSRWRRSASRRSRLIFAASDGGPLAARRGLEPTILASLPVCCAVCLSELADGEKARILPKCNHGFHLDCINMWFHSHSTCPLCRRAIGAVADVEDGSQVPSPEVDYTIVDFTRSYFLPTNVLFWGNQDQVASLAASPEAVPTPAAASGPSSSSPSKLEGALVIEIPGRPAAGLGLSSPPASGRVPSEELKSPVPTPTLNRLRSLRRILSREKKISGPSCSPRVAGDIEQGMGGKEGGISGCALPRTTAVNP